MLGESYKPLPAGALEVLGLGVGEGDVIGVGEGDVIGIGVTVGVASVLITEIDPLSSLAT
jgi:hypothetical protein